MRALLFLAGFGVACSAAKVDPDAGDTSDPSPVDYSDWVAGLGPDSGTVDFLVELTKASLGESADLDGDGQRELSVLTLADGTRVWNWVEDGIRPAFRIEEFPDARRRYTFWYSNYAAPRMIDNYEPGRRVTLIDDELDRRLDRRRTQRPYDAGTVEIVEEIDGGSSWVEVQRYLADEDLAQQSRRDALFGCDGNASFAEELSSSKKTVDFSTQPSVACSATQKTHVEKAFACAMLKVDGCLGRSNPTLRSQILAHLLTGKLLFGCGNTCAGKLASTKAATPNSAARMNFNPSYWDPLKLCGLMLHELTHTAEVGFESAHDKGLDQTYACSNYCACQNVGPYGSMPPFTPPPTMNENCARCAETENERRKCGIETKKMNGACVTNYAVCHAGLGGNANCATCGNLHSFDCVGNEVSPPRFDCCATCPSSYGTNDKPCPGPLSLSNTCTQKTPECP